MSNTLNNIGEISKARGDYETALRYLEQSLEIQQAIGDIDGLATSTHNMAAIVFQQQGKPEEALPMFLQAYAIFHQLGSPNEKAPIGYINAIVQRIGEARFQEIVAAWQAQQGG